MNEQHSDDRKDQGFSRRETHGNNLLQSSPQLAAWARSFAVFGLFLVLVAPLLEKFGIRVLSTFYWVIMWLAGAILTKMGVDRVKYSQGPENGFPDTRVDVSSAEVPMNSHSSEETLGQIDPGGVVEEAPEQAGPQGPEAPDSPSTLEPTTSQSPTQPQPSSESSTPSDVGPTAPTPVSGGMPVITKVLSMPPMVSIIIAVFAGIALTAVSISYQGKGAFVDPPKPQSGQVTPSPPDSRPEPPEIERPSSPSSSEDLFAPKLPDCDQIAGWARGLVAAQRVVNRSALGDPQNTKVYPSNLHLCYECQHSDGTPGAVILGGHGGWSSYWPAVVRVQRGCDCGTANMNISY